MKIRSLIIALTASLIAPAAFGQSADIGVVVDESGSMSGEHAWLPGMIAALEAGLQTAGVGTAPDANQYSLTGFGGGTGHTNPHSHTVDGDIWFDASDYSTANSSLVLTGFLEDGWRALNYALATSGQDAGAATNMILVTDEDRDNTSADTYASTLQALLDANALLNAVVNVRFACDGGTGAQALGIDSAGNGYVADGSGGYTTCSNAVATFGSGASIANYVNMALATGGAAWDLTLLRAGGLTATSFTTAFVAIKVKEIEDQTTVSEPGTLALFGLGLIGLGLTRRRRIK